MSYTDQNLIISIGLPIYNGEYFLRKSLDSILSQTIENFELIISDNGSTDKTSEICLEYIKKDKRINYFRQEKNIGPLRNFTFVLNKAKAKYFAWTAVDDYILPTFIEKNILILEQNQNIIGSISKVQSYHIDEKTLQKHIPDINFRNFRQKLVSSVRPNAVCQLIGDYEQKVRLLFKKSAYQVMYSVYRTEELKKCVIQDQFVGFDVPIILNALKLGDINMMNEILMFRFDRGMSTMGSIRMSRSLEQGVIGIIFPHLPLTFWCLKNLGLKIFLKNIDHFIELNAGSELLFLIDLWKSFLSKLGK